MTEKKKKRQLKFFGNNTKIRNVYECCFKKVYVILSVLCVIYMIYGTPKTDIDCQGEDALVTIFTYFLRMCLTPLDPLLLPVSSSN